MIRGVDEYTKNIYNELAANLRKRGIKSLTPTEVQKLKKVGGMTTKIYQLNRAFMGYLR